MLCCIAVYPYSFRMWQFEEHRNTLKMTTGPADLDWLVDGIQEGLFYLFYGNNHVALDALVYTLIVNCVLPIKQSIIL